MFELITTIASALPMDIDITPNDSGLPGIAQGFGSNSSNPHLASRGKLGVLISCGAAVICGASVTLINFFWNVGQQV